MQYNVTYWGQDARKPSWDAWGWMEDACPWMEGALGAADWHNLGFQFRVLYLLPWLRHSWAVQLANSWSTVKV